MFFEKIFICQKALNIIITEAGECRYTETGGILIGYETSDNGLVITAATLPGPNSLKRKYLLILDTQYITKELRYYEKKFKYGYEGSWHKHLSFFNMEPSLVDRFLMQRVVKSKNYDITQGALIITNAKPESILDIKCFLFKKGINQYKEIQPILADDVY